MGTIILIIVGAGILGGVTQGILNPPDKSYTFSHFVKSIVLGITASAITPLFLEMISSDLLNTTEKDPFSYLVFGSLCLVTAVFSRRFITNIGDKVLNELEETKKEASKALEEADEAKEDVYEMASKDSEPDDEEALKELENKVEGEFKEQVTEDLKETIKALNRSEYNYRTVNGLSNETKIAKVLTQTLLGELKNQGLVKNIEYKERPTLWALTSKGRSLAKKKGYIKDKNT